MTWATIVTPHRPLTSEVCGRTLIRVDRHHGGTMDSDLWSRSCTPRDVATEDFEGLSARGLYRVRLQLTGIASDPARLRELQVAVQTLRRIGILVEYELDLFDGGAPRFANVRENVALVRAIV